MLRVEQEQALELAESRIISLLLVIRFRVFQQFGNSLLSLGLHLISEFALRLCSFGSLLLGGQFGLRSLLGVYFGGQRCEPGAVSFEKLVSEVYLVFVDDVLGCLDSLPGFVEIILGHVAAGLGCGVVDDCRSIGPKDVSPLGHLLDVGALACYR